jgi:hypothetical protein
MNSLKAREAAYAVVSGHTDTDGVSCRDTVDVQLLEDGVCCCTREEDSERGE